MKDKYKNAFRERLEMVLEGTVGAVTANGKHGFLYFTVNDCKNPHRVLARRAMSWAEESLTQVLEKCRTAADVENMLVDTPYEDIMDDLIFDMVRLGLVTPPEDEQEEE